MKTYRIDDRIWRFVLATEAALGSGITPELRILYGLCLGHRLVRLAVPIGLFVCLTAHAQTSAIDVNDARWGCYGPQPGHPTPAGKQQFIDEAAPIAQSLERDGGPPAAGLTAMAALESGFGWTRTALFANSLFGWKFSGTRSAEGRSAWVLSCQPASDPNNRYIVFRNHADSIRFIGRRLTETARYKLVTAHYHADRAAGTDVEAAVQKWVRGIAGAGYNPFPWYPDRVIQMANNPVHPGSAISQSDTLYRFSAETGAR